MSTSEKIETIERLLEKDKEEKALDFKKGKERQEMKEDPWRAIKEEEKIKNKERMWKKEEPE